MAVAFAIAAAMAASSAAAGVYAPSLAGPGLDPSLGFSGSAGMTYTVGGGTLALTKAAGVTGAEGIVYSSFQTAGDFDARLTLDKAGLGFVGLDFAAYDSSVVAPISTTASPGVSLFSDGPGQFQSYVFGTFGAIYPAATTVTMRLLRSGNNFSSYVDGVLVSSATYAPANPLTFLISLCAGTCISTPDLAERTALITDFSVTTPGVPEPASWTMLLAGFALTGAAVRRRGRQNSVAA
jgi:hypothetical protein